MYTYTHCFPGPTMRGLPEIMFCSILLMLMWSSGALASLNQRLCIVETLGFAIPTPASLIAIPWGSKWPKAGPVCRCSPPRSEVSIYLEPQGSLQYGT